VRREDSTIGIYRYWLDKLILPRLGALRPGECDVAQIDAFFARLEQGRRVVQHKDGTESEKPLYAANTRRIHRAIVTGVMQQAVLHKAVPSNPVRELERIESPKGHRAAPPRGLTPEERRRLLDYVDRDQVAVRADMPDLIRFALGSGLRVGEICAVRWMDLDLDGIPVVTAESMRLVPIVAVRQNVYPIKGKGLRAPGD
jgi:integrase